MFEIKPQKRTRLLLPTGTVSEAGVKAVKTMLYDMLPKWGNLDESTRNKLIYSHRYADVIAGAVDAINPQQWLVRKGMYAGTFPKRLAKSIKERLDIKLDPAQLGRLGQLAKSHTMDETEYWVDIVDRIDWSDGAFGDRGSCYWSSNAPARDMITSVGGLAVRFYTGEDGGGYARAWCLPYKNNTWVIFNGYEMQNVTVAHLLADSTGLSYKRTSVVNNGDSDGMLWINGGTGYIIGEQETIDNIEYVDFEIDEDEGDRCWNCNECTGPDYYTVRDHIYCEYCYNDLFFYCNGCDEDVSQDETQEAPDGRYMCNSCLDAGIDRGTYARCENCDELRNTDDCVYETVDGYDVCMCEDCFGDIVVTCDKCDAYTEGKHHYIVVVPRIVSRTLTQTHTLCEDCHKEEVRT